ncbi:MAG: PilN domain-containing protein [Syntrophomonadaceae bacterium]|jgi:hypothetical protein
MANLDIRINLLKPDSDKGIPAELKFFLIITLMLVVVMLVLYRHQEDKLVREQAQNYTLREKVNDYGFTSSPRMAAGELERLVIEKKRIADYTRNSGVPLTKLLSAVESALPAGLVATEIEINSDTVVVKGHSSQFSNIAQFLTRLSDNSMLTNVSLLSSHFEEGQEIIFTVEMNWRYR